LEGAGDFERDARDFWENVSENARDFFGNGWAYFDICWFWRCDGLSGGHAGSLMVFLIILSAGWGRGRQEGAKATPWDQDQK
jgi:hypothetical protein